MKNEIIFWETSGISGGGVHVCACHGRLTLPDGKYAEHSVESKNVAYLDYQEFVKSSREEITTQLRKDEKTGNNTA